MSLFMIMTFTTDSRNAAYLVSDGEESDFIYYKIQTRRS